MKNKQISILYLILSVFIVWWLANQLIVSNDVSLHWWSYTYSVLATYGALLGFFIGKKWGGWKSSVGRAVYYFSIGLFFQLIGQIIGSYNVASEIDVYPSFADIGFFGSIPFYILGAAMLMRVTGVNVAMRSFRQKLLAIVIWLVILSFSYYFMFYILEHDWSNLLTVLLDFAYPFGQAIFLSIAVMILILTRSILGGLMRSAMFLVLAALIVQYFGDYLFSFVEWTPGGFIELIYMFAYFLLTLSLLNLDRVLSRIRLLN